MISLAIQRSLSATTTIIIIIISSPLPHFVIFLKARVDARFKTQKAKTQSSLRALRRQRPLSAYGGVRRFCLRGFNDLNAAVALRRHSTSAITTPLTQFRNSTLRFRKCFDLFLFYFFKAFTIEIFKRKSIVFVQKYGGNTRIMGTTRPVARIFCDEGLNGGSLRVSGLPG